MTDREGETRELSVEIYMKRDLGFLKPDGIQGFLPEPIRQQVEAWESQRRQDALPTTDTDRYNAARWLHETINDK